MDLIYRVVSKLKHSRSREEAQMLASRAVSEFGEGAVERLEAALQERQSNRGKRIFKYAIALAKKRLRERQNKATD